MPDPLRRLPTIRQLNLTTYQRGHEYSSHVYSDLVEILVVRQGVCYVTINGQHLRLGVHEGLILFPGTEHSFFTNHQSGCVLMELVFHRNLGDRDSYPEACQIFLECLVTGEIPFHRFFDDQELGDGLLAMIRCWGQNDLYHGERLRLEFLLSLVKLSHYLQADGDRPRKTANPRIVKAMEFITESIQRNLNLAEVAEKSEVSPRQLARLFRAEFGMTVQDYVRTVKVKKAKELLRDTDQSVTFIAYYLGFDSSDYFSTYFRHGEGQSPSEYRRRFSSRVKPLDFRPDAPPVPPFRR